MRTVTHSLCIQLLARSPYNCACGLPCVHLLLRPVHPVCVLAPRPLLCCRPRYKARTILVPYQDEPSVFNSHLYAITALRLVPDRVPFQRIPDVVAE